jgi:small subunit ribosomal protein S17
VSAQKTSKPKAAAKSAARKRPAAAKADPAAEALAPAKEPVAAAPAATAAEPASAAPEPGARTLTGRVVSDKMQKTIAVEIERLVRHPTYGKYVRRTTRLLAHDESGASKQGDLVTIVPCRPMSRHKSWRLLEVLEKATGR